MKNTRQSSSFRITVKLTLQPSGGYTVTCKELPELFTDGRTVDEALHNVEDALFATLELYEDTKRKIPAGIFHSGTIAAETGRIYISTQSAISQSGSQHYSERISTSD